jgi:hypothetical protein
MPFLDIISQEIMKAKLLLAVFLMCSAVAWWASDYNTNCLILLVIAGVLNLGEWVNGK